MSTCKACGADLRFIRMTSGKMMPCDHGAYIIQANPADKDVWITPDGKMIHGRVRETAEEAPHIAYRPHWASCPGAKQFKDKPWKG